MKAARSVFQSLIQLRHECRSAHTSSCINAALQKTGKGWNAMKVSDLLDGNERQVLTVRPNETIGMLARMLQRHRIGVMVVSHDGRTAEGIISERDIAYGLAERRGELHLLPVSALMTRRVITCTPDTRLSDVVGLMRQHHIRHVPVVDGGHLAGIVSIRDVMEYRLNEIERRYKSVQHLASLSD
ncbi:MAG: CBS domain-containing protein [Hyphomicrobium sp.]|uniref:CBS domain-containing protein n=1 Tax=Hyphomicrobium sp. TaxID=82 RepID=UPI003D0EB11A